MSDYGGQGNCLASEDLLLLDTPPETRRRNASSLKLKRGPLSQLPSSPHSKLFIRQIRRSSPRASSSAIRRESFRLMSLPPELRLAVFDQLFADLTVNRQYDVADLYSYRHNDHWPENDFSSYLNLLLTSKEIHAQAKGLWEKVYMSQCCFYFWKLPSLHRIAKEMAILGEPYTSAKYVLRTRPYDHRSKGISYDEAEFVDAQGEKFMITQPGFPSHDPDYAEMHWSWPKMPFDLDVGSHTLYPDGRVPVEIYKKGPGRHRIKFAHATFPGLTRCTLIYHEHSKPPEETVGTAYMLMTGKIGDIFWGAYDVEYEDACQGLWDAWQKRGFPDSGLVKAEIVMSHVAQLKRGLAGMHPPLDPFTYPTGDHKLDNSIMLAIEEGYELSNWLQTD